MTAASKPDLRKTLLAVIHAEKKKRRIEDDDYRAVIERITGGKTNTAKDLSTPQLVRLVEWVMGKARPAPVPRGRAPADAPHHKKAWALWLNLWELGALDDGSEAALTAFVRRQTGIAALNWWHGAEASPVIEALRAMCRREGLELKAGIDALTATRALIAAQIALLWPQGVPSGDAEMVAAARLAHLSGVPAAQRFIRDFGARIRTMKGKTA